MATKVSNRRSRKWMNDRLLIELVLRREEVPLSAFCRTSVGEWDAFRSIDMDAEDPFQRLLLHGVCEFYNVTSTTTSSVRDGRPWKTTTIKKRQGTGVPSRITSRVFPPESH
ncbi:unnamed protein product [Miscanthus lutarioriparius]|uniref:R3H-associated N-terminal domain-containing protein n=1 Tax=Miscanthus lutarioriparius TaxID=422564 RepID=A0A811Q711_9POAL|nr:unnamed protein product [Miscanthus lutarioriparius]